MKKITKLLGMLCMCFLILAVTSCNNEDEVNQQVKVTNNSTYSLSSFRVTFENAYNETLSRRDFGDFDPGQTVRADVPVGASRYYLSTYSSGYTFFSPYYEVRITTLNLTNDMVGAWTTN